MISKICLGVSCTFFPLMRELLTPIPVLAFRELINLDNRSDLFMSHPFSTSHHGAAGPGVLFPFLRAGPEDFSE